MKTDGSDQNIKGRELATQQREVATLRGELQKMIGEFQKVLADNIRPERMLRIVLTAVQATPKLAECTRASFYAAVMKSCELSLEPNTALGQAYLIPRWNSSKKRLECNFQIGYQGALALCYRYGKYKRITADVVYEGDEFIFDYGLDACLHHKPKWASEKPTHVYALYQLVNGGQEFKVWTWEKVMRHAEQFSESFDKSFSPWKSNAESQEAMAKKTVLINLLKYAPKSAELESAVNVDERVLSARRVDDGGHSFTSIDIEDISSTPVDPEPKDEAPPASQNHGVSAGNGAEATPAQTQTAAEGGNRQAATQGNGDNEKPPPNGMQHNGSNGNVKVGNGKGGDQLFGADEDAAMQEAYERHMAGTMGPDFG
ncbi:MAG: recombinase RecT [Treponema sp.]|jgi:recombination protein RecT|nr:recombinase RecT [Treponema sp.]